MSNRNTRRLAELFDATEADGDWGKLLSADRTRILRSKIIAECRFPRSTIYQNRPVAELIEERERLLLKNGVLKAAKSSAAVLESTVYRELEDRLGGLQSRALHVERALHAALNKLQRNEV